MGTIVINLAGAPGAGKSTGAAFIFSYLKLRKINAELIQEFAKDKTWEENVEALKPENQPYIFGKQLYRMNRCKDKVNVIITDSPLFLSILYGKSCKTLGEPFNRTVMNCFNEFENHTWFLNRVKEYNPKGRNQTESESDQIAIKLKELITDLGVTFTEIDGDVEGYTKIAESMYQYISQLKS